MSQTPSDWESSKSIAKSMLRDRGYRRKILTFWLLFVLAWIAIGQWVINDWLAGNAIRFLVWWAASAIHASILIILALNDALSVIREEREKRKL